MKGINSIGEYSTDGVLVKNRSGDSMGMFSTVSLLNDKIRQINALEGRLIVAESLIFKLANDHAPPWDPLNWRGLCKEYQANNYRGELQGRSV